MPTIYSITQINAYIQGRMNEDPMLAQVAVRGEISNYKLYPSGHHYFTLKDEQSALKCVMFKGNAMSLRFRPASGMKVIALGRISVYPRDGQYQLYVSSMAMDGIGDLYAAFEALKKKLSQQGLFDPAKKKPIPKYPQTIGVVTSSAGAAVHDILRILRRRYPLCSVRLLPVRVQGAEAPEEITSAIRYANAHNLADLLIVGRGGGSIEDLWAFNDERVAYAIYESHIPIISAVGHEPDVTIADYVADLRAATPSNGAELAVPDREALAQNLDAFSAAMTGALNRQLRLASQRLEGLAASPALRSPTGYLDRREKDLQLLQEKLLAAQNRELSKAQQKYVANVAKLDAMSPLKVLSRGYAMAQKETGELIRSVKQTTAGESIVVSLADGKLNASILSIKEASHESENQDL